MNHKRGRKRGRVKVCKLGNGARREMATMCMSEEIWGWSELQGRWDETSQRERRSGVIKMERKKDESRMMMI